MIRVAWPVMLVMLTGCVAIRVPQLPTIDRALNPGADVAQERWVLSVGDYSQVMLATRGESGVLHRAGRGQLVAIGADNRLRTMARIGSDTQIYTFRFRSERNQVSVFADGLWLRDEACRVSEQGLRQQWSCQWPDQRRSSLYSFSDHLLVWTHPETNRIVRLSREGN